MIDDISMTLSTVRKTLLLTASAAGLAAAAAAQEREADLDALSFEDIEEIVVTGSRIARDGAETPTPVTVLDAERFDRRGAVNIADVLNELPAFAATATPASTGISLLEAGANFINLRGLGANRALVLVDGRRFVSGGTRSNAVDLNAIPSLLIENVDIVTGGASAVYGSDAVAGVVNVNYRDRLKGLEIIGRGGFSDEGDAGEYLLGAAGGVDLFDDRLNVTAAIEYFDSDPLFQRDRDFSSRGTALIPNAFDTGPNDGIPAQIVAENVTVPVLTANGFPLALGLDPSNPFNPLPIPFDLASGAPPFVQFGPGGQLIPADPGIIVDPGLSAAIGGDGFHPTGEEFLQLRVPVERIVGALKAEFDVTDRITTFIEGNISLVDTSTDQTPFFDQPGELFIPTQNPLLQPEVSGLLTALGSPGFFLSRAHTNLPLIRQENERDTYRIAAGVDVDALGFDWSLYYQYGRTENEVLYTQNRIQSNFLIAVGAVDPLTGQPFGACVAPCVPLDLFGPTTPSQAAIDFVIQPTLVEDATIEQHVAAGNVTGEIVELPAGPAAFAAGFEYRREEVESAVDPRVTAGDTFLNPFFPIDGDFDVYEFYGELTVPLLKGVFLVDDLTVDAAARFADYSTVGATVTYKFGLSYAPTPDVRLRAAFSRDLRAPNIQELFQGGGGGVVFVQDPCGEALRNGDDVFDANCDALGLTQPVPPTIGFQESNIQGVTTLEEERSDTVTVGLVFTPDLLDGLSASVDYWNIDIDNAIATLDAQDVVNACFGAADVTDNAFCAQVSRSPLGQIDVVDIFFQNLANLGTSGVDWNLSYRAQFADFGLSPALGGFDLRMDGTYIVDFERRVGPPSNVVLDEAGEIGLSEWRWNVSLGYVNGGFSGFAQVRFIGDANDDNQVGVEQLEVQNVGAAAYLDLSAQYVFEPLLGVESAVFFGVDNVTDRRPPFLPSANPFFTDGSVYDTRGRFFRAGLKFTY